MNAILDLIGSHGTRIIGLTLGTLTTLVATGVIPEGWLKYMAAAIAVLTYWRGTFTSNAYNKGVADGLTSSPVLPIPPAVKP